MGDEARIMLTTLASAVSFPSFHKPRQPGVIRPSWLTAVASRQSMPAPPSDKLPRWAICKAVASPLLAEYWHIGDTTMRLGNVSPRKTRGSKRCAILLTVLLGSHFSCGRGRAPVV